MTVSADDFYFEPTFMEAAMGATATVRLHHEDEASHTFTLAPLGVDEVVDPGQTVEVTFEPATWSNH